MFEKGRRKDINNDDMPTKLKLSVIKLAYPTIKVIEIKDINTHSIRYGESDELHLEGYKDRKIQRMRQMWLDTLNIYISDKLH